MNILYCGDSNIADGVVMSVLSLVRHCAEQLDIFILTAGCSSDSRTFRAMPEDFAPFLENLIENSGGSGNVKIIDITEIFNSLQPKANMNTRFTPCCMLRLYADLAEGIPDRVLYLDNDVLCRGDISPLYEHDMTGREMAGVLDYYGRWFFRNSNNIFRMDYLNSGVLLLNMAEIKRTGLFEKCRERCRNKQMFMPDQSALNKLSKSKDILPRRWNEQRILRPDTVLQHFTTSFRFFPWFHAVSVKPWNIEGMHNTLKLHEYDKIIEEYLNVRDEIRRITK